ncbi:hypothetical protein ACPCSL_21850 [Streptomyces griseoincarnatus]
MMIFMMRGMLGQGSMHSGHDDQRRADRNVDPLTSTTTTPDLDGADARIPQE